MLYPAMYEARRVRLCFPDPPTPTSKALPLSVRMIREIYRKANLKIVRMMLSPVVQDKYGLIGLYPDLDKVSHGICEENQIQAGAPDELVVQGLVEHQLF